MMGAIPFKTEERETWLLVKEMRRGFKVEEVIQWKERDIKDTEIKGANS